MVFHRILVAVDRTMLADQVFEKALGLAQTLQADLKFVHCIQNPDPMPVTEAEQLGMAGGWPAPSWRGLGGAGLAANPQLLEQREQFWEDAQQLTDEWMQGLCDRAQRAGVLNVSGEAMAGDPSREICDLAVGWNADLIVVGRKGRKGLEEVFLGSVSNYVVHHAPCTVMVVQ